MTSNDFNRSLQLVLVDEGGLSNDPHDPGGRTAHGIIQREYNAFNQRKGRPQQDVWKITPVEYTEIYHDQYWEPWCDKLPPGVDYLFFDMCVNAGPMRAAILLQRAVGVKADGHMGMVTVEAVEAMDPLVVIDKFTAARQAFYHSLSTYKYFGKGWISRTIHSQNAARQIAMGNKKVVRTGLSDDLRSQATVKASSTDMAEAVISPESSAGIATGSGGLTGILSNVQDQLSTYQYVFKWAEYALMAIAAISLGVMIYGLIKRRKNTEAMG